MIYLSPIIYFHEFNSSIFFRTRLPGIDKGAKHLFRNYTGVTHEFFGMASVVPEAKDAQATAIADLKNAFNK